VWREPDPPRSSRLRPRVDQHLCRLDGDPERPARVLVGDGVGLVAGGAERRLARRSLREAGEELLDAGRREVAHRRVGGQVALD
jgi:hypothetical protein